ncbi:MAG: ABC transporter permease [Nitrososphaerota archaeon]|nr:ABC transporter permease [Nitrososphaerota archaeon]
MASLWYLANRAINRLATLLILMLFSFFIFEVIPQAVGFNLGFFFSGITMLSPHAAQGQLALVNAAVQKFGLNDPLPQRILVFFYNLFTLNFGNSALFKEPVTTAIAQYLPNSLVLASFSLVTTTILAIVVGTRAAKSFISSKKKIGDSALSAVSIVTFNIPFIVLALFLYIVFADELRWFPINLAFATTNGGLSHFSGVEYYLRYLWAAALPIIALTVVGFGNGAILIRNNIIDEYNSAGYVAYAKARGISENQLFYRHAFRNAMLPFVTQVGIAVAFIVGGLFFTEVLFDFPGIGYASVNAAVSFDIPFLIGSTFVFAIYTLVVLYVLDLVYARLDPRIQLV